MGTLRLHVLGSGSKGNASIIEDARTKAGILVDCGLGARDFLARCEAVGYDPQNLKALLITHEHTDHTKGLGVVSRALAKQGISLPLFVLPEVAAHSKDISALQGFCDMNPLQYDADLHFSGETSCTVHVFRTSHDAAGSCGFRFDSDDGDALGFMTDTGVVTPWAHEALQDVRILALESNHDPVMLKNGPYPYALKRRVGSDLGHLSNVQAGEELEQLLCNRLEQVVAMHISENNNDYDLPQRALVQVLERNGHGAKASVAYQRTPKSF